MGFMELVLSDEWPVTRANKQQRKSEGNVFMLSCYNEWALKLIFSYNFWQFEHVALSEQLFQRVHENTGNKRGTCKHSFSNQRLSCGAYKHAFSHHIILPCIHKSFILHTISCCIAYMKHSYCTPYHIALHTQNIHIAHRSILHCTHKTFILQTIAYRIAHAKHSSYIPGYKTWLRLEVCHSCVRFLLSVLLISPRRVARGVWVPNTNSIANTNRA